MLFFPPFRLDLADEQLWKGGKLLSVRRKPFAILKYLSANPRRLVTHEELVEHIWAGNVVSDSAVRTHLHELRQVLGEGLLETVIGRGYRFTAEPTPGEAAPVVAPVDAAGDGPIVVGRKAELAILRGALEKAGAGHRQLCFVTGEPGIGKSTLVDTFTRELEARKDLVVVRGHCVEQHSTPEAFLSVIEVLAQLRRSSLGDVVLAALIRHAPTFLAQLPHLVPDAQLDEVVRRARGGNDTRSVRELLEAIETVCANHTIVIVLEDLQWVDVATIDLIALLGQRRERARLLVLATSRHAEVQAASHPLNRVMRGLITRSGAIAMPLERIAGSEIKRFVDLRFPDHAFPEGLIGVIERITAGTPLFVVSFVEDLVGRGMLEERAGRWQLTVTLDEIAAHRPDSVRQLIDMHLDRLAIEEQRLLEAASVVGIEFSTGLVAAALGSSLETVDDLCDSLARRGLFLRRVGIEEWPDGTVSSRYGVMHGLVQEVNLERTPATRRQRWHQQIAERLEAAYGEQAPEVAHTLAMHFDNGGVIARAVHFYMTAAARSTLRFASRDALALYERAHALIRRMPATRERDITELALLEGKTQSVIRNTAHSVRAPLEIFEEMIAIARRLGDPHRLSSTLANFGVRLVTLAEYDRSEEVVAQVHALRQVETLSPAVLAIDLMTNALALTWRGRLAAACELLERETGGTGTTPIIPGMIGPTDPKSILIVQLSVVRWLLGQPERAELDVDHAIARATDAGDPYMLGHALCSRGRLRFLGGSPAHEIRDAARAGLAIPDAEVWHPQCALLVGYADSLDRPLTREALDEQAEIFRSRSTEFPMGSTYLGMLFACTAINSNDHARARAQLDDLLAFARTRGEHVVLPELVRLRGTLVDDPEQAAATYREAIELARVQQSRSFQLRAANSLASLWREGPRRAEALALVAEAVEPFAVSTVDVAVARRLLS